MFNCDYSNAFMFEVGLMLFESNGIGEDFKGLSSPETPNSVCEIKDPSDILLKSKSLPKIPKPLSLLLQFLLFGS